MISSPPPSTCVYVGDFSLFHLYLAKDKDWDILHCHKLELVHATTEVFPIDQFDMKIHFMGAPMET